MPSVPSVAENNEWKKNLPVLWLGSFLCCASFTMCVPFLPVFILKELHVAESNVAFWSGVTFAVTFVIHCLLAPYWGALADHVGQKKMVLRSGFGLGIVYILTGLCQDITQLVIVRILCGLACGFVPACMTMASASLPESRMGWGMGLMQTSVASGAIMGPLIGGFLNSWFGMRASFYASGLSLFIATFFVIAVVKDNSILVEGDCKLKHLLKDIGESLRNRELLYVMCMYCLVQSCVMMIQPLIALYVGELMGAMDDNAIRMAGAIFSMAGITGILSATFWGKRGQTRGYIKTFCLVTAIAGSINLFQMFVGTIWQFVGIQFFFGLFLAGAVPNINAYITKITPANTRGKAFGLLTSAMQSGGVIGPLLGGALGTFLPTRFVLVIAGCILLCVSLYSYVTKVHGTK